MKLITTLSDKTIIYYEKGRFDNWCVYVKKTDGYRYIPKDVEYFAFFSNLTKEFDKSKIYSDFLIIYKKIDNNISDNVLKIIKKISEKYKDKKNFVELNFVIIYAAMVAERNKKNTILKERIKHLGFYQVVLECMSPLKAANFSKGLKAKEIINICIKKGIY